MSEEVKKVEPVVEVKKPAVDATTLTFMVWMLYKLHIITRIQVKDFLDIIKDGKWPEDVVKYLQGEVAKI
jgi:hypothetical protein